MISTGITVGISQPVIAWLWLKTCDYGQGSGLRMSGILGVSWSCESTPWPSRRWPFGHIAHWKATRRRVRRLEWKS